MRWRNSTSTDGTKNGMFISYNSAIEMEYAEYGNTTTAAWRAKSANSTAASAPAASNVACCHNWQPT